jgi:hypothetical protein
MANMVDWHLHSGQIDRKGPKEHGYDGRLVNDNWDKLGVGHFDLGSDECEGYIE